VSGVLGLGVFVALLFVPAGRLDWWAAWAFIGAFVLAVLALVGWLSRRDPELLAERQRAGGEAERWDRAIMAIYTVLLLVLLIVAGLDAGRFGWSSPPVPLRVLGWLGLVVSLALVWWTMASNTYLSEVVRVQDDRDHQVATTGPYRIVRHPMYVGVILAFFCVPLILGSLWALVPALLCAILFVVRTGLEDRTLQERLPGYREYAEKVRYRLVPGVW